MNGKTVVGSGCLFSTKGDVRLDSFLIEAKYTDKDYYSLKYSIWSKIAGEAVKDSLRIPIMFIDIQEVKLVVMEQGMLGVEEHSEEFNGSIRLKKNDTFPRFFRLNKQPLCVLLASDAKEILEEFAQ